MKEGVEREVAVPKVALGTEHTSADHSLETFGLVGELSASDVDGITIDLWKVLT